ncbi:hypothetical protein G6F57_018953 [Rhizopus arrhizus]|nr:hypothetical protein G6F57_018953 [Rhizopus arrhizus]
MACLPPNWTCAARRLPTPRMAARRAGMCCGCDAAAEPPSPVSAGADAAATGDPASDVLDFKCSKASACFASCSSSSRTKWLGGAVGASGATNRLSACANPVAGPQIARARPIRPTASRVLSEISGRKYIDISFHERRESARGKPWRRLRLVTHMQLRYLGGGRQGQAVERAHRPIDHQLAAGR